MMDALDPTGVYGVLIVAPMTAQVGNPSFSINCK